MMKSLKYLLVGLGAFGLGMGLATPVVSAKWRRELALSEVTHLGARLSHNVGLLENLRNDTKSSAEESVEREIAVAVIGIVAVEDFQKHSTELGTLRSITSAAQYCRNHKLRIKPPELDVVFQDALEKVPPAAGNAK